MRIKFNRYYFRIRPEKISFFRFILEGYDGLATLSTLDARQGLVVLQVPGTRNDEFWCLIAAISSDLSPGHQTFLDNN